MKISDFISQVKESKWWFKLDNFRKNHIEEVNNQGLKYNKIFNLNIPEDKIIKAAYLHDIGKGLTPSEELDFIKNNQLNLDEIEMKNRVLYHAPISSFIAETEFGILDKDILDSVRYHTVSREEMSKLEKLIYFSDFISPDRKLKINKQIESEYSQGLDKLLLLITSEKIKYLLSTYKTIHPNIIKLRNKLIEFV